jgi:hypothetical protein
MTQPTIASQWSAINKMVDGLNQPGNRTYSDEELGKMFRSYVAESIHNGWDGFERSDKSPIRRMLYDMTIYINPGELRP